MLLRIFFLLLLLIYGCSHRVERPNVLLILVDALRSDHLRCYGYERNTSPNIDALAAEGTLFRNAWSQSPWTKPSIPSLFTSLYPVQHGVYEGNRQWDGGVVASDVLPEEAFTIAEAFRQAGYRTLGLVNNAHLQTGHGFAQGFKVYQQKEMNAQEINKRFLTFVSTSSSQPFFAYLHYLDVHFPFQPKPPYDSRFPTPPGKLAFTADDWRRLRQINDGSISLEAEDRARLIALHDGAIAEVDHHIGELMKALRKRGVWDRTIVLLTSDHGEELFDHNQIGHGETVFEETLRIPMILRGPGVSTGHTRDISARTIDVFPTLLDAAGMDLPTKIEGRSLLDSTDTEVEQIAETRHKRTYRIAVTRANWKLIRTYEMPKEKKDTDAENDTFGLRAGMRVRVNGWFLDDGTLQAEKVTLKDASDEDVEVSGPISEFDRRHFRLYGVTVIVSNKSDDKLREQLNTLSNGKWIKAQGEIRGNGTLVADKIESLDTDDQELEIEGILQSIDREKKRTVSARLSGIKVVFDKKTRVRGFDATSSITPSSISTGNYGEDPFAPKQLRSANGLKLEEQLFNLAVDPQEQRNLAESEPERLKSLQSEMDHWLQRMSQSHRLRRGERENLDSETIERLKALGYVR